MVNDRFRLTKWYLDCVEPAGRTAIGYWATCSWRGVHVSWHDLTVYDALGSRRGRSSFRRVPAPTIEDGVLQWAAPTLGCSARCTARSAPFATRLLASDDGAVDWRCEMAAGACEVTCPDGPPLRGPGYVECLALGVAPWRLPIDEFFWGRWSSADLLHSIVWIQWRGTHPLTLVLLDGQRQELADVDERSVVAGHARLRLCDSQVLAPRSLRAITRPLSRLSRVLPSSILALSQTRWRSKGVLEAPRGAASEGWAVHEHVRLR